MGGVVFSVGVVLSVVCASSPWRCSRYPRRGARDEGAGEGRTRDTEHKGYPSSAFGTFSPLRRGEGLSKFVLPSAVVLKVHTGLGGNSHREPLSPVVGGEGGRRPGEGRTRETEHQAFSPLRRGEGLSKFVLPSAVLLKVHTGLGGDSHRESLSPALGGEGARRAGEGRTRETEHQGSESQSGAPAPSPAPSVIDFVFALFRSFDHGALHFVHAAFVGA